MGLRLVHLESGEERDIPSDQARYAILSGEFGAPAGTRVPVRFRDGGYGDIPVEEAWQSFNAGAQYDDPVEREERARAAEFAGRGMEAAGLGGLSGITLGLGPQFLKQTGLVAPRTMAGIEEYNTGAYRGAEILTSVAPIFATVGAGAGAVAGGAAVKGALKAAGQVAAKNAAEAAARVALKEGAEEVAKRAAPGLAREVLSLTPPALAARAGLAAERATAKLLGEKASQHIAGQIVTKAVGTGVEGAPFGLGLALDENALGDTELTGEHLLAGLAKGTVFGIGAGGVMVGGAALVGNALRPALVKATKRFTGETIEEWMRESAGESALGALTGRRKSEIKKRLNDPQRHADLKKMAREDVLPKVGFAADVSELAEGAAKNLDDHGQRLGEMYDQLDTLAATPENRLRAFDVAQDLRRQADDVAKMAASDSQAQASFLRREADKIESLGGRVPTAKELRAAKEASDRADEAVNAILPAGDEARKAMGGDYGLAPGSKAGQAALRAMDKVDEIVERATTKQKVYDDLLAQQKAVREHTLSFREYQQQRAAAAPPSRTYGNPEPTWSIDAKRDIAETWNRFADAKAEPLAKAAGISDSFKELRRKFSLASQLNELATDRLAGMTGNRRFPLTSTLAGVGAAATGDAGTLVSLAKGAVMAEGTRFALERGQVMAAKAADAIATKIAKLKVIKARAEQTANRTQGAVDTFIESAKKTPQAVVPVSVWVLSESTFEGGPKIKSRAEAYAARTEEVRRVASNPVMLTEHLAKSFAHINDAAPNVSATAQARAAAQVLYLADRIYKDPYSDSRLFAHIAPDAPDWAQAEWMRLYAAFDDPAGVLEEWAKGSFNPEGWKFLERFYPKHVADFKSRLVGKLAKMKEPPGYALRLRLDQLGIKAEPTARPEVMAAVQASFMVGAEPAGAPAQGGSVRSDSARTQPDRIASGVR